MLKLDNITAGYGRLPVIREISIGFEQGGITSVIGPNGSGKSTLLKAILGLCEVQSGGIYLNGRERRDIPEKEYAGQLAYLPQSRQAGAITVGRMVLHGRFPYLSYPRRYRKEDYEYCRRAMERAGILQLKEKRVEELSGGQKQKVSLAMVLAGEADTLLMDEPAAHLDIRYQLELLELMKEMRGQGKTVIAVLHDLNYAMNCSDSLVVMSRGTMAMQGSPEEVYQSGILEEVFQVRMGCISGDDGRKHYIFDL